MQSRIIVPLDGSPLAEGVLPQIAPLARALGSTLSLLRVVPIPVVTGPMTGMAFYPDANTERWQDDLVNARVYLADAATRVQETTGLPVQTEALVGDPTTMIVGAATDPAGTALIAMTTHGRTGLSRWIFGSVAEAVLHAAPVPLLLVHPPEALTPLGPPAGYKMIVVPLDGSPFAEQALAQARAIAQATGATLLLVAAVADADEPAAETGTRAVWDIAERKLEAARMSGYLQTRARELREAGLTVDTQLAYGHPAEAVLRAGEDADADLLVMATHGRTGFQRLRMGSVALKVVQGTRRPVLLLRAQATTPPLGTPHATPIAVAPPLVGNGSPP